MALAAAPADGPSVDAHDAPDRHRAAAGDSEAVPSRHDVQCITADGENTSVVACYSRGELLEAAEEKQRRVVVVGQREVGSSEQRVTGQRGFQGFQG